MKRITQWQLLIKRYWFSYITSLCSCKPVSGCITLLSYKAVHNSFIKSAHKSFYVFSIKPVHVVVHNCSFYDFSPVARNVFVHASVCYAIFKTYVSLYSKYTINVRRKVFKVILQSLSVNTVCTSHVHISPTQAVVMLNSYSSLHVCDVLVSANLLCHVRKISSPTPSSKYYCHIRLRLMLLVKIFFIFTNNSWLYFLWL